MALWVQKFGGTSVASIERLQQVAKKVYASIQQGHQVVVVVSAMAGQTDTLETLGFAVNSVQYPRERDVLLAAGEQMTVALLAMALQQVGLKAQSYLGHQLPIYTDSTHTMARIAKIETKKLKHDLAHGIIPVVAGFQGVDEHGDLTTLGRGGSDTTAVALAAALKADECQIFTDVDGVYSADPKWVKNARLLKKITLSQMLEMASLGSKVVQWRAVALAGYHGVPVRVLSTFTDGQGTLITAQENDVEKPQITGITHSAKEVQLFLKGMPEHPGLVAHLLSDLGAEDIEVDLVSLSCSQPGTTDLSILIPARDAYKAEQQLQKMQKKYHAQSVELQTGLAKLSMVGTGLRTYTPFLTLMFQGLAQEKIQIRLVTMSEIKVSLAIDETDLKRAMIVMHEVLESMATTPVAPTEKEKI